MFGARDLYGTDCLLPVAIFVSIEKLGCVVDFYEYRICVREKNMFSPTTGYVFA